MLIRHAFILRYTQINESRFLSHDLSLIIIFNEFIRFLFIISVFLGYYNTIGARLKAFIIIILIIIIEYNLPRASIKKKLERNIYLEFIK